MLSKAEGLNYHYEMQVAQHENVVRQLNKENFLRDPKKAIDNCETPAHPRTVPLK